ncbi:MAG: 2-oxoacid:acceptor oxidoreductase family protein [Acetobacteraceae bacterium]|nr:2-oxoacid:acceptor oxidoreductase family protein [Acetobacteraceae bacterium]
MERFEALLSGSGGQGMILAGIVLAEAAVRQGLNAVQSQSYGPEARGGASKSEVIVSSGEIDFPRVTRPRVVLCMSPQAFERYGRTAPPGALVVVDSSQVGDTGGGGGGCDSRLVRVPITALARERAGRAVAANMVAVGLISGLSGVLERGAVLEAMRRHVPRATQEANERALQAGLEVAESVAAGAAEGVAVGGARGAVAVTAAGRDGSGARQG